MYSLAACGIVGLTALYFVATQASPMLSIPITWLVGELLMQRHHG